MGHAYFHTLCDEISLENIPERFGGGLAGGNEPFHFNISEDGPLHCADVTSEEKSDHANPVAMGIEYAKATVAENETYNQGGADPKDTVRWRACNDEDRYFLGWDMSEDGAGGDSIMRDLALAYESVPKHETLTKYYKFVKLLVYKFYYFYIYPLRNPFLATSLFILFCHFYRNYDTIFTILKLGIFPMLLFTLLSYLSKDIWNDNN